LFLISGFLKIESIAYHATNHSPIPTASPGNQTASPAAIAAIQVTQSFAKI
jgi:hypothetical protein